MSSCPAWHGMVSGLKRFARLRAEGLARCANAQVGGGVGGKTFDAESSVGGGASNETLARLFAARDSCSDRLPPSNTVSLMATATNTSAPTLVCRPRPRPCRREWSVASGPARQILSGGSGGLPPRRGQTRFARKDQRAAARRAAEIEGAVGVGQDALEQAASRWGLQPWLDERGGALDGSHPQPDDPPNRRPCL